MTGYFASADSGPCGRRPPCPPKDRRADLLSILVDPVIGDEEGGLYVEEPVAAAIRDRLLPIASIATPNHFELGWLSSRTIASDQDAVAAALALPVPETVATSAAASESEIVTMAIAGGRWRGGRAPGARRCHMARATFSGATSATGCPAPMPVMPCRRDAAARDGGRAQRRSRGPRSGDPMLNRQSIAAMHRLIAPPYPAHPRHRIHLDGLRGRLRSSSNACRSPARSRPAAPCNMVARRRPAGVTAASGGNHGIAVATGGGSSGSRHGSSFPRSPRPPRWRGSGS